VWRERERERGGRKGERGRERERERRNREGRERKKNYIKCYALCFPTISLFLRRLIKIFELVGTYNINTNIINLFSSLFVLIYTF